MPVIQAFVPQFDSRRGPPDLRGRTGFGLIEMLVGTVLIILAGLALVSIVMHMSVQNHKAQTQSRSLALQSQIVTALTRDDTFSKSASFYNSMKTIASDPTAGAASIDGVPLVNAAGQTIAVSGQRVGLDLAFNPCDPTVPECPLRVDMAVRCLGAEGCQSAYRVMVAPGASEVGSAALGAPVRTATGVGGHRD